MSWQNLKIDIGSIKQSGKTLCPKCSHTRTKQNDRCLSVDVVRGLFNCHHCKWHGSINKHNFILPNDMGHDLTEKTIEFFKGRGISKETLLEAGITEGLSFMGDGERNAIHFNYIRDGILINIKYRDAKKQFKLFKDSELILYNIDSIKETDEVIITEGEIDCLSFMECGIKHVVSVPNGANKNFNYMAGCVDYFKNKKKIYIAVDNDEAGKVLCDELVRRFGKQKCWIIDFGKYKDANELLMATDKEELIYAYKNAVSMPLDDIHYAKDLKKIMLDQFENGREHGTTTFIAPLDEHFTWKKGQLTLFHGIGNRGKSTFVYFLCLLQSMRLGTKWAVFSPEHYPANEFYDNLVHSFVGKNIDKKYQNRCTKAEYERGIDFIHDHFYYCYPENRPATPEYINQKFEELIIKHGISGGITDPFNQLEKELFKTKDRDDVYLSEFLQKEKRFAQMHSFYKIIVAHPSKLSKNGKVTYDCPDIYDIANGAMWNNKCDNIIAIHAPNWHEDKSSTKRLINIQKIKMQQLVGMPGEIYLDFDRVSNRYF